MDWNPFKKAKDKMSSAAAGMMSAIAMKKLANMSDSEKQKMMEEMTKPENRDKLISALEMMKKAGQVTEAQYQETRKKLGL